jgi:penicillin G amidase
MNPEKKSMKIEPEAGKPVLDGTCSVQGIRAAVNIIRDEYGVAYIQTEHGLDAWFGLGFCQAQDRLFQLEVIKRQARGTLSELFGSSTLPADRFSRQVGFYRIGWEYLNFLKEDQLSLLKSFTDGINAGIQKGLSRAPLEFDLLKAAPTIFEPADVMAIQLLLTLSLSHWVAKLTRFQILLNEGLDAVEKLDPEYASWNYLISPVGGQAGDQVASFISHLKEVQRIYNRYGISNNWVISSNQSNSGRPVLGNDPHLSAELPATWYLASMDCAEFHLNGACFPGSPFFLAGFNGFVSWGITAGFIDNIDLYLEKFDRLDNTILRSEKKYPCRTQVETINVKDEPPQQEKVILADHGPLLTPLYKSDMPDISMRATWFEPKGVEGFFVSHLSRTAEDFRRCFEKWPLIPINLVFADAQGEIAWQLAGEIPDRKIKHGLVPLPGWDDEFSWNATDVSFERKPHLENPPANVIVTANNKPVQQDDDLYIGRDYIDGYRHARQIHLLLTEQKKSWEDLRKVQLDQFSQPWSEMREKIIAHQPGTEQAGAAHQYLSHWDGVLSSDSVAATIYEFFIAELTRRIISAASLKSNAWVNETFLLGIGASNFGLSRISQVVQLLNEQPDGWFKDGWQPAIDSSLSDAFCRLNDLFGPPGRNWGWGQVRKLQLRHILTNLVPTLDASTVALFNPPAVEYGGDEQTVNVAAGDMCDPLVKPNFIANLRMLVDVGHWEHNSFSLAGGQSGSPYSPHYTDLFQKWLIGEGISIVWDRKEVNAKKMHEFKLMKE